MIIFLVILPAHLWLGVQDELGRGIECMEGSSDMFYSCLSISERRSE